MLYYNAGCRDVVCKTQAVVAEIDWSAVDDLSCGIELEVSGDCQHPQLHTDGPL